MDGQQPTQQQQAQAMMAIQEMVQGQQITMKILGKCFSKCVDTPGSELSRREQDCIYNCTKLTFDTEIFIGKRLESLAGEGQH
eukprot:GDKH01013326.1.p1 GENE.GDKH01013326.1~~GDKH01013326.1.p1  ORF type:complete len:83 (+),score=7.69 GDKH01013326.1:86-334(+)